MHKIVKKAILGIINKYKKKPVTKDQIYSLIDERVIRCL